MAVLKTGKLGKFSPTLCHCVEAICMPQRNYSIVAAFQLEISVLTIHIFGSAGFVFLKVRTSVIIFRSEISNCYLIMI